MIGFQDWSPNQIFILALLKYFCTKKKNQSVFGFLGGFRTKTDFLKRGYTGRPPPHQGVQVLVEQGLHTQAK